MYDSRENCNAIIHTATNTLMCGCDNTTIPNSVMAIEDWAFADCSLMTSIVIPESVTSIGDKAFRGCIKLTSVTVGNGVTTIGDNAFDWCFRLASISLGDNVTSIGDEAFYGCRSISSITVSENNPHYQSIDGSLYSIADASAAGDSHPGHGDRADIIVCKKT